MPMNIISQDEVLKRLKEKQGKRSMTRFAKLLGISTPNLSAVYKKKMLPGKKILRHLDLGKESTRSTIYFEMNGAKR